MEEKRVALIGIMVENYDSAQLVNETLHGFGKYIIGRMGLPYQEKNIHIISVAIDAPSDVISSLGGKLGMIPGVVTKTIYGKV